MTKALNVPATIKTRSLVEQNLKRFLKDADPFLVIEKDNEIVGFMIILQKGLDYESLNYTFFCNNYSNFDYVDRIVISEDYRGQKFGTELYEYLFNHSDKKFITCEVNIRPPNEKSMGFHKSLGFKKIAEQITEGGNKSVAMMVKEL